VSLFQKAEIKKREREGYTQQDTGYSQLRKESLQELQLVKRKERGKKKFEEKESDVKKRERRGQQKKGKKKIGSNLFVQFCVGTWSFFISLS